MSDEANKTTTNRAVLMVLLLIVSITQLFFYSDWVMYPVAIFLALIMILARLQLRKFYQMMSNEDQRKEGLEGLRKGITNGDVNLDEELFELLTPEYIPGPKFWLPPVILYSLMVSVAVLAGELPLLFLAMIPMEATYYVLGPFRRKFRAFIHEAMESMETVNVEPS